ncbi:MAG: excinuclease ABC subunit UvrC [Clostridia bacterium]|nr:excinuclease ABC subunit UvrC [Clostridia bacterium]
MPRRDWGETLETKIAMLPESPGCYLMKDAGGTIIYVGKAVNLKNRVRSYFRDADHTPKVAAMVENIADFDVLLCDSNLEALCLECNLIKRHRPHYNILLKDDKHYPYICVNLREPFPRLELARRMPEGGKKDGMKYFGPYIGATAVRQVIEAVRGVFPLRTCRKDLPLKNPCRPCVNYEIGKCMAPCAGKCTEEAYWDMMDGVLAFLGGDYDQVLKVLHREMMDCAAQMKYERAAAVRDKIRDIEGLMERQIAIRTERSEQDVIALAQDGLDAMVHIFYVRGGRMIGGDHFALPREGSEAPGEVLAGFLTQYYEDGNLIPRNVLVQTLTEGGREQMEQWLRQQKGAAVTLLTPQRGEKHDLILLAAKNAADALEKRNAKASVRQERTTGACAALARALGLEKPPRRIEGYDISNTQGVLSVASMVVFIDGVAAKKEYRHFRIKTVEGANDFASLNEVLGRRFARGLQEKAEREAAGLPAIGGKFSDLPDLVLIDGGPQQLRFARQALLDMGVRVKVGLQPDEHVDCSQSTCEACDAPEGVAQAEVAMFGLAKKQEEIFLPDREEPILLDHHTPELHLIQRVRDEAHRFCITHHRGLRGKASIHSQLEDIPGIGPKRRKALLTKLGSMKAICEATEEQLLAVPGMTKAAAEAVMKWAEATAKNHSQ